MEPAQLLDGLDPEQRAVALAQGLPVAVLAGAGTGKTRAITHRLAYGVHSGAVSASRALAVTFTTKAAGEMTRRLAALGAPDIRVRTFHAAALRQLRYFWAQGIGGPMPELASSKIPLVASAARRTQLAANPSLLRDLASEIEWSKVNCIHPEAYAAAVMQAGRVPPAGLEPLAMARTYAAYEDVKEDAGRIDFEDVLLLTSGLLENNPAMAEAVRSSFRHITVDEYQDVSPAQQRLLELWAGDSTDLCVVGDPAQTIYTFAGATPEYLRGFASAHPGAQVIELVRSYRCTPPIVEAANRILAAAPTRAGVVLRSMHESGRAVAITEYDHELAEAEGVADMIAAAIDAGANPSDIAILVRLNAMTEAYEEALAERGVPYVVRGGERFFDRGEVRKAMVLLRGSLKSSDSQPGRPLGVVVRDLLMSAGWTQEPPTGTGAVREAWESLSALVALADERAAADPAASVAGLVDELTRRAELQDAPTADGVALSTIHAAKGMEWDSVWLVGLSEGILPLSHANTPDAVEEERRLLYVGITRAAARLELSYAAARSPGGRRRRRSRFLDALAPAPQGQPGGPRAARKLSKKGSAKRCRSCGAGLSTGAESTLGRCADCPPTYDEAAFERLRQWRTDEAAKASEEKGSQVPAYVIATDATLEALAEHKPASDVELAKIPGIGSAKLARYGPAILDLLRAE